jgi:hypothetical protein
LRFSYGCIGVSDIMDQVRRCDFIALVGIHETSRDLCSGVRRMMTPSYSRDMIGYGPNPPDPQWPDGARLAVNFVLNYEEGSEPSFADGDGQSETGLT